MTQTKRGRYAPSPTGELHLGNASTALLAWLSVRAVGGRFVMRVEDLDAGRSRPELMQQILDDLRWLGLDWDEGPNCGGPHGPYDQASRTEHYVAAFQTLHDAGVLYPCFCSRKDILAAASAPQTPGEERRYPGTCRGLDRDTAQQRMADGERHAFRFRVAQDAAAMFDDLVLGRVDDPPPGDFVVRRSDGVTAYQLAVVVDDAAMEINEVVRGNDLLASTPKQLLLISALGLAAPSYGHAPLLMGIDGARLSKRQAGITIRELRERGLGPREIIGGLAQRLGLAKTAAPRFPADLVAGFDWLALRSQPRQIVIDPSGWSPGSPIEEK